MRQYFINETLFLNSEVIFDEQQSHHIRDVLRMSSGDIVRLVDNEGHAFLGELHIDRNEVRAQITSLSEENNDDREIVCCCALIKKDKWELLLQKAAELGASKIVPLVTNRTVINLEQKEIEKKLERWNKITKEACQQSNRTSLCEVMKPVKLKDIVDYKQEVNLVAYESENDSLLRDYVTEENICFAIGPEGGWDSKEIAFLQDNGFACVSLGPRILRAETAVMFVLSVIEGLR